MNKEYRKFNELSDVDVYIPPATEPGHFSNLPDVLVPADYYEEDGDPLEKDVADLIRETKTPPPTPPEEEPGKAGCRVFRDVTHYVAPIYLEDHYQRELTVKLIMGYMAIFIPSIFVMILIVSVDNIDYIVVNSPTAVGITFGATLIGVCVYIYFVGLFRNPPMLYVALGFRVLLNTALFTTGMLIIHISFLKMVSHAESEAEEHNHTAGAHDDDDDHEFSTAILDHAPPYMAILMILLLWTVLGIICVLLHKYEYPVNDYRIPFVIYTTCHSTSAILVTIAINNGFQNEPLAYDLFQIIFGCFATSMLLMRTPSFTSRLFEGKVCPLREGELVYALNHYGL